MQNNAKVFKNQKNIGNLQYYEMFKCKSLTDVTLVVENKHVEAHKLVLASNSLYFKESFVIASESQHPVMFLKGITYSNLMLALHYMYCGEIVVLDKDVEEFKSTLAFLEVIDFEEHPIGDKVKPPEDSRLYKCAICEKHLMSMNVVMKHMSTAHPHMNGSFQLISYE